MPRKMSFIFFVNFTSIRLQLGVSYLQPRPFLLYAVREEIWDCRKEEKHAHFASFPSSSALSEPGDEAASVICTKGR